MMFFFNFDENNSHRKSYPNSKRSTAATNSILFPSRKKIKAKKVRTEITVKIL